MPIDSNTYVDGEPHPNQQGYASFEYKGHSPGATGGGYPRWRSWEYRPETTGTRKEDVYVPVHRLCAVAWLFPDEWTAEDVLESEHLVGSDVHHELGMPSANLEAELSIRGHGEHAEITNAQLRAWAADRKSEVGEKDKRPATKNCHKCVRCDDETETLARNPAWEGAVCIDCSRLLDPEGPVEVVTP